jgi:hypothetical protein
MDKTKQTTLKAAAIILNCPFIFLQKKTTIHNIKIFTYVKKLNQRYNAHLHRYLGFFLLEL